MIFVMILWVCVIGIILLFVMLCISSKLNSRFHKLIQELKEKSTNIVATYNPNLNH